MTFCVRVARNISKTLSINSARIPSSSEHRVQVHTCLSPEKKSQGGAVPLAHIHTRGQGSMNLGLRNHVFLGEGLDRNATVLRGGHDPA